MERFDLIIKHIRSLYGSEGFVPLHAPVFFGNEKKYLERCIDSTYVSSVGEFVERFEMMVKEFTGAASAVATVNGTTALHAALDLVGVRCGDLVITQPLTFVATCNAISMAGAVPAFVDVDIDTMGMSPESLMTFLDMQCQRNDQGVFHTESLRRIGACVPMHTFGHPARVLAIAKICQEYDIPLIEDAAESLGSFSGDNHTGLFGACGILSFNGNKTITTGGGGMIITKDSDFGSKAKHLTTTAKIPHQWDFIHDRVGYNYRMPNINAALGCAQMEVLQTILAGKRVIAESYKEFFADFPWIFLSEPDNSRSNYWLNTVITESEKERDDFLEYTNNRGIMTRPPWKLMTDLVMYENCPRVDTLVNAKTLRQRAVNLPSGLSQRL